LLSADGDHFSDLLVTLGLPWTLFLDSLGKIDTFSGVSPAVLTMLAPAINLAILFSNSSFACDSQEKLASAGLSRL
jgi:hypothetical protein